jgi:hypothetical protein
MVMGATSSNQFDPIHLMEDGSDARNEMDRAGSRRSCRRIGVLLLELRLPRVIFDVPSGRRRQLPSSKIQR